MASFFIRYMGLILTSSGRFIFAFRWQILSRFFIGIYSFFTLALQFSVYRPPDGERRVLEAVLEGLNVLLSRC